MELEKDIKVYSYFMVDMDPDKLAKLQNALQLAKQNTLPGQVMFVPIAPGIAFRYAPENGKKCIPVPSPALEVAPKGLIDRAAAV